MPEIRRVCVAQISIEAGEMQANLDKILATLDRYRHCDLLVFPELVVHGHVFGQMSDEELAEGLANTPPLKRVAEAAKRFGLRVLLGSIEEHEGRFRNVAVYLGKRSVQRYAKTHVHWTERFTPGNRLTTFDSGFERIGPLICFDAAFPEAARTLALMGAKVIAVLAAVPSTFDADVMARRMASIAVMNQVFVIFANRGGPSFSGGSGVWNPKGERIAGVRRGEQFLEVEIDLNEVEAWRCKEPIYPHRQPKLYRRITRRGALPLEPESRKPESKPEAEEPQPAGVKRHG